VPEPLSSIRFPSLVASLPITRQALEFASVRHRGQRRDADAAAFILHPLEVAQLLKGRDYPDVVIAAGVLHDIVEDAHVEPSELADRFGPEVAALVQAVTEPSAEGSYRERKARLRDAVVTANGNALAIYAADKVAKTRELRLRLVRTHTAEPDAEQLEHYWASLELLERRLGHHALVAQLRFELETLALLPPAAR
jgi:(p)ppGpp synthase/HD superfamily hydrolase